MTLPAPLTRTLVLVGMPGSGKSTVGRRLALRLGIPFVDADAEIESAAGCTIEEIFAEQGEPAFREGERRVIARLLEGDPHVLATGGGAFNDPRTRERIAARGISVWLSADVDMLMRRVARRTNRPLLKNPDPRGTLERMLAERAPIYALADITVESAEGPPEVTAERVVAAIEAWLARQPRTEEAAS